MTRKPSLSRRSFLRRASFAIAGSLIAPRSAPAMVERIVVIGHCQVDDRHEAGFCHPFELFAPWLAGSAEFGSQTDVVANCFKRIQHDRRS